MSEYIWERYSALTAMEDERPHIFLKVKHKDKPWKALEWTICKTKDGYYISEEPYPPRDHREFMASVKAGPFDKLAAAKVAYRLHLGMGKIRELD